MSLSTPPQMPTRALKRFERLLVPIGEFINLRARVKATVQLFVRYFSAQWVIFSTRARWQITGEQSVLELPTGARILLVGNHRSFFDMYVACATLYAHSSLIERLYFPVRFEFFYTNPVGALLNLCISGGAMWPPVFRDARRETLNEIGLQQIAHVLKTPGTLVGIHPEGRRNKGDPYTLLPPRRGIGELVLRAPPGTIVLPFFQTGLSNRFLYEFVVGFLSPQRAPIRLRWATPMTVEDLQRLGTAERVTEAIHQQLQTLADAERDRALSQASGTTPP